jgi:hypothetical protein
MYYKKGSCQFQLFLFCYRVLSLMYCQIQLLNVFENQLRAIRSIPGVYNIHVAKNAMSE